MLVNQNEVLYSLSDVAIIPSSSPGKIEHRSECRPFTYSIEGMEDFYPVIAAPMSSVVSHLNYAKFHSSKISCVIPRSVPLQERLYYCTHVMCAFSLQEIVDNFINNIYHNITAFSRIIILIDIANGHMEKEIETGKMLRNLYGDDLVLMGGNIGNPEMYPYYNDAGFDFLRVGIGGGSQCLTSTQTGIHYPMASLVSRIYQDYIEGKIEFEERRTKIVADGGINSYSDAIKCLALGADYVMMGKVFAKAEEACGPTRVFLDSETGEESLYRQYYGMSTKRAQAEILGFNTLEDAKKDNNVKLKTSEGRSEYLKVEYTLKGWADNFDSYLRSAMSYTGYSSLPFFKRCQVRVISPSSGTLINGK